VWGKLRTVKLLGGFRQVSHNKKSRSVGVEDDREHARRVEEVEDGVGHDDDHKHNGDCEHDDDAVHDHRLEPMCAYDVNGAMQPDYRSVENPLIIR
jgi:hypothetical protein